MLSYKKGWEGKRREREGKKNGGGGGKKERKGQDVGRGKRRGLSWKGLGKEQGSEWVGKVGLEFKLG